MADTPVPGDTKPATTPGSPATAPIGEFAGVDRNPYVYDTMGILYPRDPTLAARGGGRSYLIYDEAELDPRVFSVMQKRKRALAAFPWMVTEASSAPADKAAAELVERALHAMNFSALCEYLNDAILKGFSVVELIWELVDDRWWFPVEARIRDQRRFRFDKTYVLRMIDRTNLVNGFELPARKFIVHTFNPKDGDPYGRGLGAILWWRAFFKRQNEAAWLIHNEKYGSPTAVGTYPVGAGPDTQQALLDACRAFSTDSAIIKPDGSTIELLEASGSAGADTFSLFKESQNDDISETVLGATFAANAGPLDGGAGADADTEDRLELARSDADNLAQVLNKTIVAWIVWINMPAAR
ncbi:MAG TPA: DUF935 family protein, partial [Aliidongia sp.]|uniref:phage portal protein family protein n=1 Tax=Aliidongia sp. TaxID=1914230 RepID=UPI002DDD4224